MPNVSGGIGTVWITEHHRQDPKISLMLATKESCWSLRIGPNPSRRCIFR